ncbi:MAG: hypothetical protein QOD53_901 [Thermoleophilaceae bacterium]|nr:hypothetical protein [Thermoleophilaceae bacterium]
MADSNSFHFAREPGSVPEARAALARLEGQIPASSMYDASLCLSELVTNAVQHPGDDAGDLLELTLTVTDDVLRVQVADPGGAFQPGEPTEGDERGWGLFIVDQLSSRWGSESGEDRTVIWFEIDQADAGAAVGGGSGGDNEDARREADAITRLKLKPAID